MPAPPLRALALRSSATTRPNLSLYRLVAAAVLMHSELFSSKRDATFLVECGFARTHPFRHLSRSSPRFFGLRCWWKHDSTCTWCIVDHVEQRVREASQAGASHAVIDGGIEKGVEADESLDPFEFVEKLGAHADVGLGVPRKRLRDFRFGQRLEDEREAHAADASSFALSSWKLTPGSSGRHQRPWGCCRRDGSASAPTGRS